MKINKQTRYLGILLDSNNTMTKHKNKIIMGTYFELHKMRSLIHKRLPINLITLQQIYNSKARSRMEYGIIIHTQPNHIKTLEKIQNQFFRLILNIPKTTPTHIMNLLLQAPTMFNRYQ